MDDRGVAARLHDLPAAPRRAAIAVLLGIVAALSWWGVAAVTPDLPVALWWPAAAVSAVAVLVSRGRRISVTVLVAVIGTLANLSIDRSLELSIAFGIANAAEAWVVAQVLTRGGAHARLRNMNQMGWFMISGAAGAAVIAVIGAAGVGVFVGSDPVVVAAALFTSHMSAVIAIMPVALVPLTIRMWRPTWELVVQTIVLTGLTVIVFGPAASLAITFLIVTTLMWSAFRFPPLFSAVQTIGLAAAATLATANGIGPFSVLVHDDARAAIFALQLFILTHAAAGLFVAAQSAEWRDSTAELASRERDALAFAHRLEDLNAQKDDFIAAVSHELRTPVTSILGFSEELAEPDSEADSEQAGRIIYRNARRLADVIEDVLELSRLSTTLGSNRPAAEVDVGRVLAACAEDIVGLLPTGHHVRIELQLPDHEVVVNAVQQDLERVFTNLLTNAVKFSPEGAAVSVSLTETAPSGPVEVRIVDVGPGIPLAEQEAVWERFYRVQSPQHRDVPGTGLGLPIVRALVEHRIGGEVSLISDGEHGTTAVVQIPRVPTVREPLDQPTVA